MTLVYMFYKIIVYKTLFYIILFYITMVDMTFFYDTMVYNSWQACHVSFVESLLSTQYSGPQVPQTSAAVRNA